jgi:large subunit ribosomal protein L25
MTKTTRVEVPVELVGESAAVRVHGGSLIQALYTVLVEARPMEIPPVMTADATIMEDFDKAIRVSDLEVADGVAILTDPEQMVAHVTPPINVAAGDEEAATEAGAEPERVEAASDETPPEAVGESDGDTGREA